MAGRPGQSEIENATPASSIHNDVGCEKSVRKNRINHSYNRLVNGGGSDQHKTGLHTEILTRPLLAGLDLAEARERADEAAAFTELGDYLAMPVNSYSDGMRFRLGFAAWTSSEPDILLVDEWIVIGDSGFRDKAYRLLEAFADGVGIVVLASHDAGLLRRLCTTAVLLEAGWVRATGPVGDVLDASSGESADRENGR